ncbi:helix-turn-helix transcriptional regulator [Chelatococcus sp. SYSU_G07232]|uniref:Helix-turn-helix transcriptional regulator n=1 Tax=Chelatococcus albus TaxID=3047466 RepID=A0ABT7AI78_9HYPH|nr:helix-turn-helix transcriptional regulator [Chelatococcus sp. SYSU_G07232]MDJ1159089.1 helix-turn-helix transcriptional regulator [Chelatococcus sp. SYSU_G07232]
MHDWGKRLQHALLKRRISKLYALAAEIGVNESAMSRWKKSDAISVHNAIQLCAALDISLDWLLMGRGSIDAHKDKEREPERGPVDSFLISLPDEDLARLVTALERLVEAASSYRPTARD